MEVTFMMCTLVQVEPQREGLILRLKYFYLFQRLNRIVQWGLGSCMSIPSELLPDELLKTLYSVIR